MTSASAQSKVTTARQVMLRACCLLLGLSAITGTALAQEPGDIFKTEIFLSPIGGLTSGDQADHDYPRLSGKILAMSEFTQFVGIRDGNGEIPRSHWHSIQPTVEAALAWQWNRQFFIGAKTSFNSAVNVTEDNAFSDLGMDMKNLFASYRGDNYALYAGKFDIGFGDGWHVIDGLYSGFTSDYRYEGVTGLGGRYSLGDGSAGQHSLSMVLFRRDDSVLNRRLSFDDGLIERDNDSMAGMSNRLSSFIVSYDFARLPGLNSLSGGIDAGRLQADEGDDANVLSARLRFDHTLADGWDLSWYNEATFSDAYKGAPVSNGNAVTALTLSHGRWQFAAATALRKINASASDIAQFGLLSGWDWGISGTVTYVTPIGIILQSGLTHQKDQSLDINQGVMRIAYQMQF